MNLNSLLSYVSDDEQTIVRWFTRKYKGDTPDFYLVTYGGEYHIQCDWPNIQCRFNTDTSEVIEDGETVFVLNGDLPKYIRQRVDMRQMA